MTKLRLEVADTPTTLAYGLMKRNSLPKDQGMLFKLPPFSEGKFWGKDTYIPLDIAFLDKDNKIASIKNIAPMSTRIVASDLPCSTAIEANSGFFANNQIEVGFQAEFINNGQEMEVIFKKC